MAKFTPGPWWIDDENGVGAGNQTIAVVKPVSHPILRKVNVEEWNANTCLIAVAPDLYEALKNLLACSTRNQEHYSEEAHDIAEHNARAVIARATGE